MDERHSLGKDLFPRGVKVYKLVRDI
jgi:hypothetical protein